MNKRNFLLSIVFVLLMFTQTAFAGSDPSESVKTMATIVNYLNHHPGDSEKQKLHKIVDGSDAKDYEKAIESFKQVIHIQPDYTFAHYSLGMIYLVQGDKNAALDEYKILKDLDQDIADQLFDMIYK